MGLSTLRMLLSTLNFKPQVLLAIVILGAIAGYGLYQEAIEITTGCTGGIIALGMKLLEHE